MPRTGATLVAVHGSFTAMASLVAERVLSGTQAPAVAVHSLSCWGPQALGHRHSSWVHRLRCPEACGIFPDQGSNLYPLHCRVDSQPLGHQGSPETSFLISKGFLESRRDGGRRRLPTALRAGERGIPVSQSPIHLSSQSPGELQPQVLISTSGSSGQKCS